MSCHDTVGVNLKSYNDPRAAGLIGPNLTHFGSRDLIASGVLTQQYSCASGAVAEYTTAEKRFGIHVPEPDLRF